MRVSMFKFLSEVLKIFRFVSIFVNNLKKIVPIRDPHGKKIFILFQFFLNIIHFLISLSLSTKDKFYIHKYNSIIAKPFIIGELFKHIISAQIPSISFDIKTRSATDQHFAYNLFFTKGSYCYKNLCV